VTDRLSKLAYPGGASVNYLYFPNSGDKHLQQIKNVNSTSALISQLDYTYDAEGEITTWKKNYAGLAAPQRFDLGYDGADQLLTAPLKNATTNALVKQYTYGYDLASNRTSELVGTVTTNSSPNNVNEITSQSGGKTRTLTYDLNGSITSDVGTRTFQWDGANRLIAINYTGATTRSEFSYDGLNRIAKIVEKTGTTINSTTKFVWCGNDKCEVRDAANAVVLQLYSQGEYESSTPFYTRDHLGSVREMFKSDGTVVARLDYDLWGRPTQPINTNRPHFGYTGLYLHSASGLNLATYRAYDPDLGRWISRDPIAERGGLNLYAYAENNALRRIDPTGLASLITIEGTGGTGVTIFDPSPQGTGGPYFFPSSNSVMANSKDGAAGPYTSRNTYILPGPHNGDPDAYGPNRIIETDDQRWRWIHGGGSGLLDPSAPYQGWYPTHGCTRMQDQDIDTLTKLILNWRMSNPNEAIPYSRSWPNQQLLKTTYPGTFPA
jgi:RHS repeat-associated protein